MIEQVLRYGVLGSLPFQTLPLVVVYQKRVILQRDFDTAIIISHCFYPFTKKPDKYNKIWPNAAGVQIVTFAECSW